MNLDAESFRNALHRINMVVPWLPNPMFTEAVIDVRAEKMRVANSTQYWQTDAPGVPDMQLVASKAKHLEEILAGQDNVTFEVTPASYDFEWSNTSIYLAKPLTNFFDGIEEVLLKPVLANDDLLTADTEALRTAVAQVMQTMQPKAIELLLDKGEVTVAGADQNRDYMTVKLEAEFTGPKMVTCFQARSLQTLVNVLADEHTTWRFGVGTRARPAPLLAEDKSQGLTVVLSQTNSKY